jgi:hypothetical protein
MMAKVYQTACKHSLQFQLMPVRQGGGGALPCRESAQDGVTGGGSGFKGGSGGCRA